jgi:hypothetical protein
MKHNQRTPVGKRRKSPSLLERIQPAAAGIDCGEKSHYVAVPRERDPQPVREFRTFTGVTPFRWTVLGCGTKSPADDSFRS